MNSPDPTRLARQIDRNTERLDSHAALIADLAARMHITEHQAERLWEQIGKHEKNNANRHAELMDAIHELKTDGRVLHSRVEMSNKMAGKMLGGIALLLAAAWAAWQLGEAVYNLLQGAGA